MGSGARPKERVRVIVSDLPREEIYRLRKCTGVAKPCIVTVEGVEYPLAERRLSRGRPSPSEPAASGSPSTGSPKVDEHGPMRIMASSISWQD